MNYISANIVFKEALKVVQLSIKQKLILLSLIPILALVFLGFFTLTQLNNANKGVDKIYMERVVPLKNLKVIADNYAVSVIDAVNKANAGILNRSEALEGVEKSRAEIEKIWSDFKNLPHSEQEGELKSQAVSLFKTADDSLDELVKFLKDFSKENLKGELSKFDGPLYDTIDPISEKISDLIDLQIEQSLVVRNKLNDNYVSTLYEFIVICTLVVLVLAVIGWLVIKNILASVDGISSAVQEVIDNNDLTVRLKSNNKDEFSRIASYINQLLEVQSRLINDIKNVIETLSGASNKVNESAHLSLKSTKEQFSEVEMVVSAMTELVASYREVTSSAELADKETNIVYEKSIISEKVINEGIESINNMLQNVDRVSQQINTVETDSINIGSVVDVINSIAEQTNLLALNAAIEAARAGDQGRGFAVVADEVRTLAQRTQVSTTEIQEAVSRLQAGTIQAVKSMASNNEEAQTTKEKVLLAGQALKEISSSMKVITDMNAHIASASEEQSSVAEEINRSINKINDSSQISANSADEMQSTSDNLLSISNSLKKKIGVFKL